MFKTSDIKWQFSEPKNFRFRILQKSLYLPGFRSRLEPGYSAGAGAVTLARPGSGSALNISLIILSNYMELDFI